MPIGFGANYSCETILVKITDEWLEAMDKGLFTGVVMIDLRKAFDVVDPINCCSRNFRYIV